MRLLVVFGVASLALACSKDPAPGQADFARGGIPDDSIKTAPILKPVPAPTPTLTARVGTNDDGVKPLPKIAPAPVPAPVPTPR